jgi:hypothetical protein
MTDSVPTVTRIRLARSLPRLLVAPLVIALVGAAAVAGGVLVLAPPAGVAVTGAGAVLLAVAVGGVAAVLSVRLAVEEADVVVSWLGGRRRYRLASGPVTRVRLRGPNPARLRVRGGARWWGVGLARLRDEEDVQVVRLALTRTAILIPTDRGRLAVAPAHDDDLLAALSRAARVRQLTEALADSQPRLIEAAPEPPPSPPEPEPMPVALTGIERALLEERLVRERVEEESRAKALRAAEAAAATAVGDEAAAPDTAMTAAAAATALPAGRRDRRARRIPVRRPGAGAAFVLMPTIGAGLAWAAGASLGQLPASGTDLARLTSLALVLAGPATSIGVVMALAWWPRLVGLVVAGGLAASVLIGRALLGL